MNDLSPEARALIAQALADDAGPSVEQQTRVHRAVSRGALLAAGIALSPAAAAGGAAAGGAGALGAGALASVGLAKVVSWVGVGFIGGALALGTAALVQSANEPTPSSARAVSARESAAVSNERPPRQPDTTPFPEPPRSVETAQDPEPRAPAQGVASRRSRPSSAPALSPHPSPPREAPDARLERELELMARVQERLQAGDARTVLALIVQHRAEFGAGPLADEILAAEILARCATGEIEYATRLAAVFLARAPNSPLAARIRNSCAGMEP